MEVSAITTNTNASDRAGAKLAEDFDQFLALLTAQLMNQDPLDPLDSNEFVNQLVSFTEVEQSITTNAHLESLIAQNKAGQVANAVSYLGTTVEATGDQIVLTGDAGAPFIYTLTENTRSTSILIANEDGDTVFTSEGQTIVGEHGFVWDGFDNDGNVQPDGVYKITVSAFSLDDSLLSIPTVIGGRVTRVETDEDGIQLTVNGIKVSLDDVLSVEVSPPPEDPDA